MHHGGFQHGFVDNTNKSAEGARWMSEPVVLSDLTPPSGETQKTHACFMVFSCALYSPGCSVTCPAASRY